MQLPEWISIDLTKAYYAAERKVSPRLEELMRTDAAMDAIAVSLAVRRIAGGMVRSALNGAVEAVGLPSSRQVARLQRALDEIKKDQS
ncbi:hypothetical protein ACFQE5_01315 [Pseudonocardia hispaniensis]|uniref:Uncharacterized protein n=1 Tax=Pseudonocardia hispaniensis TaxID=904933 RepID=A0ABW1IXF8_9PSEU